MKSKLKLQNIENLKIAEYLKDLKVILNKARGGACSSPETAVNFFVKMDYIFEGKEMPLILFAKMTPDWKKWAKDQLKGNKKVLLAGTAYLKQETSGFDTLMITPQKGAAKLDKIAKKAKAILKRAKVQLALATPVVEDTMNMGSQAPENNASLMGEVANIRKLIRAFYAIPAEEKATRREAAQTLSVAIDAFLPKVVDVVLNSPQLEAFVEQLKNLQTQLASALRGAGGRLTATQQRAQELLRQIFADYQLWKSAA